MVRPGQDIRPLFCYRYRNRRFIFYRDMTSQFLYRFIPAKALLATLITTPVFAIEPLAGSGYGFAPPPAWVIDQKTASKPVEPANEPLFILLSDIQTRIAYPAPVENYRHRIVEPLTMRGVESASQLELRFNPAFEHLDIHAITIRRGQDVRNVTRTANIRVVQREEQLSEGIQDGAASALIVLDDVRVGDIIDYSYSVTGNNPIFGDRYFGFLGLDESNSIDRLHIRLLADPGKPLHTQIVNQPGLMLASRMTSKGMEYTLTREHVAPVLAEDYTPPWISPYSWLEYSGYADWSDVEHWARELYTRAADTSGPLFDTLYRQLALESSSKAEFVTRALFFVQNEIRYLGLEFGENSHRPHAPEEVLKSRFGDCKDKALLLASLLAKHGITAHPALVSTGFQQGIGRELASPGLFDHVITYVELDGKTYWLDGTRRYQAGSLDDLGRRDFGLALVISESESGLRAMYPTPVSRVVMSSEENYYATDFNGPVRYEVISTFYGNAAETQREYFANTPINKSRKDFADFSSRFHDGLIVAKPMEIQDDKVANRFLVREYYRLNHFWEQGGDLPAGMVRIPLTISTFTDTLRTSTSAERKYPVVLPSPGIISNRVYLHLPENINLKLDDKAVITETPYIRFTSADSYLDKLYYGHTELEIKAHEIPAAAYADYRRTLKELYKQWDYTLAFRLPTSDGKVEIDHLKEAAGQWSAP